MRRLLALGAFSLAGALIPACGDDDPSTGNGGSGGRGGSAGTTGNGGTAGNGGTSNGNGGTGNGGTAGLPGNGGSSGTGGSSGDGGTGGTGGSDDPDAGDGGGEPPCTGCVEFRVPLTGNNQNTTFQFSISPPADLTNGVVTYRIRALTIGAQLVIQPFSTDNSTFSFDGQFTQLNAGNGFANTDDFIDVVYDLSDNPPVDVLFPDAGGADGGTPVASDHDKSQIIALGFQLGSAGAFTTDFEDPITFTVLLDSITFAGVAGNALANRSFADSVEGFVINDAVAVQPGSVIIHHPE